MSFEQTIDKMRQSIAEVSTTGTAREITATFTEAEANEQANKLLTQAKDIPLEIKSVRIDFQPNNNLLTEIEAASFSVKIKVKSKVGTKNGKPVIEVTDINLGIFPLPDSMKQSLADLFRQKTEELLAQLSTGGLGDGKIDLVLTDIRTREQDVTVTMLIKPKA